MPERSLFHSAVSPEQAMSLSLYGVPDGAAKRAERLALPIRILTDDGARVALQRCPILRAGGEDFSTALLSSSNSTALCQNLSSGFLCEATNRSSSGFLHEATGRVARALYLITNN